MNIPLILAALSSYNQTLRIQALEAHERIQLLIDDSASSQKIEDARCLAHALDKDVAASAEEAEDLSKYLAGRALVTAKACAKRRGPKLYEVSALVNYVAVICAVSEKDALREVETWENAWHDSADLLQVSDVEIIHTSHIGDDDPRIAAHDITLEASKALASSQSR